MKKYILIGFLALVAVCAYLIYPNIKPRMAPDGDNTSIVKTTEELAEIVRAGDYDLVYKLIEQGADVNQKTRYQNACSPLAISITHNHLEIFDLLLKNGAEVIQADSCGNRPIHYLKIVHSNSSEMLLKLLDNGAMIDQPDNKGTPLLHALSQAYYEPASENFDQNRAMIRLVLSKGANINGLAKNGAPVHYAVLGGALENLKFLIEQGADPQRADQHNKTPYEFSKMLLSNEKRMISVPEGSRMHEKWLKKLERKQEIIDFLGASNNAKSDNP